VVFSILFGLLVDGLYPLWGVVPQAVLGQAGELIPRWAQVIGAVLLVILSLRSLAGTFRLPGRLREKVAAGRADDPGDTTLIPNASAECSKST
jgi:hypothetical protein